MSRLDIPEIGKIYDSDEYKLVGKRFSRDSGEYKFVKFVGGQIIRDGESLTVNTSSNISVVSPYEYTDAVAVCDINTFPYAATSYVYTLVKIRGEYANTFVGTQAVAADLTNKLLVNDYITGTAAGGNRRTGSFENMVAEKTIAGTTTNTNTNATSTVMAGVSTLFVQDLRVGDVLNTNTAGLNKIYVEEIQSNTVCLVSPGSGSNVNVAALKVSLLSRSADTKDACHITGGGLVAYNTQKLAPCVVNLEASAGSNLTVINANAAYYFRVDDVVNVINANGTAEVRVVTSVNTTSGLVNCNAAFTGISTATNKNNTVYVKNKAVTAILR
ncbi:MAG: hypothetical protein ACYDEI_00090 [Erysipelotrichaceae bacterium]